MSAVTWTGGMRRRPPLDREVRGRVEPRILQALEARGWHVHRVGGAAYVHRDDTHYLFAVTDRRRPPAPWLERLDAHHRWIRGRGPATGRELRRLEAAAASWSRARLRDSRGRFAGRPAWWQGDDGRPLRPWLPPRSRRADIQPVTGRTRWQP